MPLFPSFFPVNVYWDHRVLFIFLKLLLKKRLGAGSYINELRQKITEYLESYGFFPTNRGTTAIELALMSFKRISPPDKREVLLPAYICPSVIQSINKVGLKPKFVGINKDLNISPYSLQENLESNVLAVIIPHIYGYPAPIKEAIVIIKNYDKSIFVIDDAASAFGIKKDKQFLGTFGDVGIVSFNQAKMITASWGGGLVLNNPLIKKEISQTYSSLPVYKDSDKLKEFINFWWLYKLRKYSYVINYYFEKLTGCPLCFSTKSLNEKRKMANLDAAIILDSFPIANIIQKKRSRIIKFYIEELKEIPFISIPQKNAHLYHVSRFYILTHGLRVFRNTEGTILKHNPLAKYLLHKGIKTQYGYHLPYKDLYEDSSKLEMIESLIMLPIDHTKPVQKYKFVVDAIKRFYNAK